MNIPQEPKHTVSELTRLNHATSKKHIPISAVLMAALLALLASASPGIAGQTPVNLRSAGSFVILSKTGITDVYASAIVGNVGTSPITGAALLLACDEVVGTIYAVDAAGPACSVAAASLLTTAISDMQTAYTDAAGRSLPDATELGAGNIDGKTITPGLYKWSSSVLVPTSVTLRGGPNDVWIFQIAGDLTLGNGAAITLSGGAQAKNIFWQVAGQTTLGTTASFKGIILCQTLIAMNTGAVMSGRALAQTAVTLQMNAVTKPD
jgi:Ice-binding-like